MCRYYQTYEGSIEKRYHFAIQMVSTSRRLICHENECVSWGGGLAAADGGDGVGVVALNRRPRTVDWEGSRFPVAPAADRGRDGVALLEEDDADVHRAEEALQGLPVRQDGPAGVPYC